jgi:hypothetical protein
MCVCGGGDTRAIPGVTHSRYATGFIQLLSIEIISSIKAVNLRRIDNTMTKIKDTK